MLPPAETVALPTLTGGYAITGGACLLRGWSFVNTDDSNPAALTLYDGSSTDGPIVTAITLNPNESTRDYPAGAGIGIRTALYIDVTLGSVTGAVWINPATRVGDWELVSGERLADFGLE